jgi:putative ABC transport system permease protein
MLKNYFKIAWRNLWKNKLYSFITISGLSLAMAGAILLLLWIQNAVSVDKFHLKADNLYRIYSSASVNGYIETWDATPVPLAAALKSDCQEINQITRVAGTGKLLRNGERKVMAKGNMVDAAFLNMFNFPLIKGDAPTALSNAHSIIITEKFAKKIFSDEDPMNKTVFANADVYTVSGVLKDLPNNTQFDFDFLLPWKNDENNATANSSWNNSDVITYAELAPLADKEAVNKKVSDVISKYSKNEKKTKVFLFPLAKVWLYGNFINGKSSGGGIDIVYILGVIAFILLFIGCINFMNLSTARSEHRAKEVGVRKVTGAGRKSLIIQFIAESVLFAFIAGIIALMLAELGLPFFNTLTEKHLIIEYKSFYFWMAATGFVLFTGILAGSYPAFYLSSFRAVNIFRNTFKRGNSMLAPRKILVVLQFVVSIVMINYCYTIIRQTTYVKNRATGFVMDDLAFHPMTDDLQHNFEIVKQELLSNGEAIAVNKSNGVIANMSRETSRMQWNGNEMASGFKVMTVNSDFIKTNGLKLIAGRDIDITSFPGDTASCVINETGLKMMGGINPIGQQLKENGVTYTVVGTVKDFINDYPGQENSPLVVKGSNGGGFINIRLKSGNTASDIKAVNSILKKYNTNYLTEVQFAGEEYAHQFKGAEVTISMSVVFTIIAIFISCLGLFGLGAFTVESKKKEIGIRKVVGASTGRIVYLLTSNFIKLVMIAILIASPIAWLLMKSLLQNFYYRIDIGWWILMATGLLSIFIALFTVSINAVKAAVSNPVKSLRTE